MSAITWNVSIIQYRALHGLVQKHQILALLRQSLTQCLFITNMKTYKLSLLDFSMELLWFLALVISLKFLWNCTLELTAIRHEKQDADLPIS